MTRIDITRLMQLLVKKTSNDRWFKCILCHWDDDLCDTRSGHNNNRCQTPFFRRINKKLKEWASFLLVEDQMQKQSSNTSSMQRFHILITCWRCHRNNWWLQRIGRHHESLTFICRTTNNTKQNRRWPLKDENLLVSFFSSQDLLFQESCCCWGQVLQQVSVYTSCRYRNEWKAGMTKQATSHTKSVSGIQYTCERETEIHFFFPLLLQQRRRLTMKQKHSRQKQQEGREISSLAHSRPSEERSGRSRRRRRRRRRGGKTLVSPQVPWLSPAAQFKTRKRVWNLARLPLPSRIRVRVQFRLWWEEKGEITVTNSSSFLSLLLPSSLVPLMSFFLEDAFEASE